MEEKRKKGRPRKHPVNVCRKKKSVGRPKLNARICPVCNTKISSEANNTLEEKKNILAIIRYEMCFDCKHDLEDNGSNYEQEFTEKISNDIGKLSKENFEYV